VVLIRDHGTTWNGSCKSAGHGYRLVLSDGNCRSAELGDGGFDLKNEPEKDEKKTSNHANLQKGGGRENWGRANFKATQQTHWPQCETKGKKLGKSPQGLLYQKKHYDHANCNM